MTDQYVPDRFRRAIALHVIKNMIAEKVGAVPLLLGIHGPSGDGKTFQCELILKEFRAEVFLISGGQLESREAGEPAQLLRRAYLDAGHAMRSKKTPVAVVLINDVDTGLGSWGEMVQYTINRQTVFGELMHFVDYPTRVEGQETSRVPIILTGNDFTKLYKPLVRAGRMTAFQWIPSVDERTEVAANIFPEIGMDGARKVVLHLDRFAKKKDLGRVSIAFFTHLRSSMVDAAIWQEIVKQGTEMVISRLTEGQKPHLKLTITTDLLIEKGCSLLGSGDLINHLGSR